MVKYSKQGRLGGEQGAEELGMGSSSSLAAHEYSQGCPLPTHSASSQEHHVPFALHTGSFSKLSGQAISDSSCKELVSIFSRQSQKLWEVMGSLSLQRVVKGNDQSQAPERMVMSASLILSHLPRGGPCSLDLWRHINSLSISSSQPGAHSCLAFSYLLANPHLLLAGHRA